MATSDPAAPAWSIGLVDDAGLFPPEELSMADALARHRRDLAEAHPALSHRFVCPLPRLAEVIRASTPTDRLAVIALGSIDEETVPTLAMTAPVTTVEVVGLESRVASTSGEELLRLRGEYPDLEIFLEVTLGPELSQQLDQVGAWGVQAKVRCGGVSAEAFPTPNALAAFVVGCVRRGLGFKATAGLHHALSHHDPLTGFDHFGFAHLLAATAAARAGSGVDEVATLLTAAELPATSARWAEARSSFRSFGSCSTAEPLADLADLERV